MYLALFSFVLVGIQIILSAMAGIHHYGLDLNPHPSFQSPGWNYIFMFGNPNY